MSPADNRHYRSLPHRVVNGRRLRGVRPPAAYRQRGSRDVRHATFSAPETWHEASATRSLRIVVQPPGKGYWHPLTPDLIRDRLRQLPAAYADAVEVIQLSSMTRKRMLFPCYGMQWGPNVYLYPIEASLIETYVRPPTPQQVIEARMFGGVWTQHGTEWRLTWTEQGIRDFYLNNVLIHEIGHVIDSRNTNAQARERFAIWFATEYGYRVSRGRR